MILFLWAAVITFAASTVQIPTQQPIEMIQFSSGGMSGHFEEIKITSDSITIIHGQRRTGVLEKVSRQPLPPAQWNMLMDHVRKIDLHAIETLESPTMARAYDGAKHSEIVIHTSEQEAVRHSFDDENPHAQLQPLMTTIRKLADSVEQQE